MNQFWQKHPLFRLEMAVLRSLQGLTLSHLSPRMSARFGSMFSGMKLMIGIPLPVRLSSSWFRSSLSWNDVVKPCEFAKADLFCVLYEGPVLSPDRVLSRSGTAGAYVEPRSADGQRVLNEFMVIWASKLTLRELLHLKQTNPAVVGLARRSVSVVDSVCLLTRPRKFIKLFDQTRCSSRKGSGCSISLVRFRLAWIVKQSAKWWSMWGGIAALFNLGLLNQVVVRCGLCKPLRSRPNAILHANYGRCWFPAISQVTFQWRARSSCQ